MGYFSELRSQVQLPLLIDPQDGVKGLRRAQLGAIAAIQSQHTLGMKEPGLITMPTGSGKTGVLMTAPFLLDATRVLIVTPSRIVRYQIAEDFRSLRTLKKIGILPDSAAAPSVVEVDRRRRTQDHWEALRSYDVAVSTPSSASPAYQDIVAPPEDLLDLILVDEAHHSPAHTWQSLLSAFPAAKRLLFTATPFRRDEQVIEGAFLYVFPVVDAYADGIFSRIEYIPVIDAPDRPPLRDVRIAQKAETVLREDRDAGFPHTSMVRTDTKARAEELLELYAEHTDLKLDIIHSGLSFSEVTNRTQQLRSGVIGGNTGVDTQPQGQLQQLMNIVEFGFGAQQAVDQPRFVSTAFPPSTYPHQVANTLQMESSFPDEAVGKLPARGHEVVVGEGIFGSANVIIAAEDGSEITVGAESRTNDAAGTIISGSS